MMKTKLILFAVLIALPAFVQAQIKIGYVSPQEVISQMPEAQAAQATLQQFVQEKQQEIVQKQQAYQTALQDYQSKAEVMSESQNSAEEEKLMGMQTELQNLDASIRSQVQQKQAELFNPIMQKVNGAIASVAESNNLDFVFNAGTSSGDSIILHVDQTKQEELDITDDVLAQVTQ